MTIRRTALGALLTSLVLLATACTDTVTDTTDAGVDTTEETSGGAVDVTMVDYAYGGIPATVEAGTTFTVANASENELHELVAFLLPADETRSIEDLAQLPPEELQPLLGQPETVLLAAPGGPQVTAVGSGTLTEPGRYAIFCFIPVGADPQEYLDAAAASEGEPPQVEGGPPHFTEGMFGEMTVTG